MVALQQLNAPHGLPRSTTASPRTSVASLALEPARLSTARTSRSAASLEIEPPERQPRAEAGQQQARLLLGTLETWSCFLEDRGLASLHLWCPPARAVGAGARPSCYWIGDYGGHSAWHGNHFRIGKTLHISSNCKGSRLFPRKIVGSRVDGQDFGVPPV